MFKKIKTILFRIREYPTLKDHYDTLLDGYVKMAQEKQTLSKELEKLRKERNSLSETVNSSWFLQGNKWSRIVVDKLRNRLDEYGISHEDI